MSRRIRKIQVAELKDFISSKEFEDFAFYPISKLRALSHINNPRAEDNDIALFLYYDNEKFVGYLGGVPEIMYGSENTTLKVFWLSCMWILPEYRRSGVALELMNFAFETYNGKTLITNYIPQSKGVFDKTGNYSLLTELDGIRGFLRFDLQTILQRKYKAAKKIKPMLKGIDSVLNTFVNARLKRLCRKWNVDCTYKEILEIDDELNDFIKLKVEKSIFKREKEVFNWIIRYPWIVSDGLSETEKRKYYFSQQGKDFKQWFIKVKNGADIVGFLILTRFNGELKTPYIIYEEKHADDIAFYIAKLMVVNGVKTFVCHDQKIAKLVKGLRVCVYSKISKKGFLISNNLKKELQDSEFLIFEGDGDSVFT